MLSPRACRRLVQWVLAASLVAGCASPPTTYTVRYDSNGGTGAAPSDSNAYATGATAIVLEAGDLTYTGHAFVGWSTQADGGGALYQPNGALTIGTSDITLHATWRRDDLTFTVTYEANGAIGAPPHDSSTYTTGSNATVLGPEGLSRSGYTFAHWNTAPDDSGVIYPIGSSITIGTSDTTLYASWRLRASIALGDSHSAALHSDGRIYTWGSNEYGQLGDGTLTGRDRPTPVDRLPVGASVIAIALGRGHSAAALSDGSLYTWGSNEYGQLGHSEGVAHVALPTLVAFPSPHQDAGVVAIALGAFHSAALLGDGSLYTWGFNGDGRLGHGTDVLAVTNPTLVSFPSPHEHSRVISVALGGSHSAALLDDGSLYTWGSNVSGQLGPVITEACGDGVGCAKAPARVGGFPDGLVVTAVAAGSGHSAAILSDGNLYTWGWNGSGELGRGSDSETPGIVAFPDQLSSTNVTVIALGASHSAAVLGDGSLYTWGASMSGQLGHTDPAEFEPVRTPVLVSLPSPHESSAVSSLALGFSHSAVLLDDGSLYAWGGNNSGQLGDGSTTTRYSPTRITTVRIMTVGD
jgi:alpha-tubulin suppressor-like RCC1 family protein